MEEENIEELTFHPSEVLFFDENEKPTVIRHEEPEDP